MKNNKDAIVHTPVILLDTYNRDPEQRRVQRTFPMLHKWHKLSRGEAMTIGSKEYVIVGFHRGKGGMYVNYGPTVDEVAGWALVSATYAKSTLKDICK